MVLSRQSWGAHRQSHPGWAWSLPPCRCMARTGKAPWRQGEGGRPPPSSAARSSEGEGSKLLALGENRVEAVVAQHLRPRMLDQRCYKNLLGYVWLCVCVWCVHVGSPSVLVPQNRPRGGLALLAPRPGLGLGSSLRRGGTSCPDVLGASCIVFPTPPLPMPPLVSLTSQAFFVDSMVGAELRGETPHC